MLFLIIADTKEANSIIGIRGAPKCKMRCRMCTSTHLLSKTYLDAELQRTDEVLEVQQRRGQDAWLHYVTGQYLSVSRRRSLT